MASLISDANGSQEPTNSSWYHHAIERLVSVVQELSLARNLETIMEVVRRTARELTGADGATFVLRDGDFCYYADENAITPLWKGQRFPSDICVSGWVMLNRQAVVIEDIYKDSRIPIDAYRSTFVKSMAMVPIRTASPIGALGIYWATQVSPHADQVRILQALADSTSIALENAQLYTELEQRVRDRTAQLEFLNSELEAFSYSVSHDLRAPVRHIRGFSDLLQKQSAGSLDAKSEHYLANIVTASIRMGGLIDDLLAFSRIGRAKLQMTTVSLPRLVRQVVETLRMDIADRSIEWKIAELAEVHGDVLLLLQVFSNLIGNAVKYTGKRQKAVIEIGTADRSDEYVVYVRDNGAGFDMKYADKLFGVFQRLHDAKEFEGTGIGLANVRRIVSRHGGRTWGESVLNEGATFYVALPKHAVISPR